MRHVIVLIEDGRIVVALIGAYLQIVAYQAVFHFGEDGRVRAHSRLLDRTLVLALHIAANVIVTLQCHVLLFVRVLEDVALRIGPAALHIVWLLI